MGGRSDLQRNWTSIPGWTSPSTASDGLLNSRNSVFRIAIFYSILRRACCGVSSLHRLLVRGGDRTTSDKCGLRFCTMTGRSHKARSANDCAAQSRGPVRSGGPSGWDTDRSNRSLLLDDLGNERPSSICLGMLHAPTDVCFQLSTPTAITHKECWEHPRSGVHFN